jgi:hypothetical protein
MGVEEGLEEPEDSGSGRSAAGLGWQGQTVDTPSGSLTSQPH